MHLLIIGVGSIGERHLRSFLRIEGVRCSIAEPDDGQRQRIATSYTVTRTFPRWEDAPLSEFDGVVICAPTHLHVPWLTHFAREGIPVLCEKPLAITPEGIGELHRALARGGAPAGIAFCLRHHPLLEEIRQRIENGDLGRVRVASYYSGQYWPRMRKGWPPAYAQRRETGGGAIPDHLVHFLNLLEWYFGPTRAVSAFQRHLDLPDLTTEDYGTALVRFGGGEVGQLTLCLFQHDPQLTFQVVGDAATARFELGSDHLQVFEDRAGKWRPGRERAVDRDELFLLQARHFLECIRGTATPKCTVAEAEQSLQTVLAALQSSDNNSEFVRV